MNNQLTGRKATSYINKQIKAAKTFQEKDMWQTLQWMHKRRSMKTWTVSQLVARYNETIQMHNITVEKS